MSRSRTTLVLLLGGALLAPGAGGQEVDRIWGRVETVAGEAHEGFIRWDRNEAAWSDLLDGSKRLTPAYQRIWLAAVEGEEVDRTRTIELRGFRISWEEPDPEFPSWTDAAIRFGHLRELVVTGDDAARLTLRSGLEVELAWGSTDLGHDMRELLVEVPGRGVTDFRWGEVHRITFREAPAGMEAAEDRLHGTATDRWGNRYTGYISWDRDEALTGDVLNGEEEGREREIPFGRIETIARDWGGARVTLSGGEEVVLEGSNDVGWGHRGVQVSDPALGLVHIPWDDFEAVRFHPPADPMGYSAFDGGHRLAGTVRRRGGETVEGTLLWDADETWSWEMLNGAFRDVDYEVELALVDRIERASSRSARVTLLDGRVLELEGSNDVSDENRGILVAPGGVPDGVSPEQVEWILVAWDDLDEVRFHHD